MRSARISPVVVAIIGSVLTIVAAVLIVVLMINPTQAQYQADLSRYNENYPDSTMDAQNAAKKKLESAQSDARTIYAQWDATSKALMPPFDVSQRYQAWGQLARELSYNLGPSLERWITRTGVIRESSISVQPPPSSPNDITGSPLIIPVAGGTVQVGGDFRTLLTHVVAWNQFNRLVQIDGLALSGNSPFMQATYRAEVIIFPQNPGAVDKPIGTAGTGGRGGGPGGFPGGPGGMPGGPGGFPGGGPPGGPGMPSGPGGGPPGAGG